jgi:hypothetical protein
MFTFTLLVQKRVSEAQKRVDNARLFDSAGLVRWLVRYSIRLLKSKVHAAAAEAGDRNWQVSSSAAIFA